MMNDDIIGKPTRRVRGQCSESEADSRFITTYFNAISLTSTYELSASDIDMLNRTKRYHFQRDKEYKWTDSKTGEVTIGYSIEFNKLINDQIYALFKEDPTVTSMELFDNYIQRYRNLPAVLFVMDSNEYEISLIKQGYTYPYLIHKFKSLFDVETLKRNYTDEIVTASLFSDDIPKVKYPSRKKLRSDSIKNKLYNNIHKVVRPAIYNIPEFLTAIRTHCGGCVSQLIRDGYLYCDRQVPTNISVRKHIHPGYIHPVLRKYLKHLGIYVQ